VTRLALGDELPVAGLYRWCYDRSGAKVVFSAQALGGGDAPLVG